MASSTQWETVTHKKKATIADKKAARKALAENRPTIDELPTIGQSSTMFEAFEKGKKSKPKTQNNVTPSKQAKSNKKTVSKKNTKKDGGYKTLEEALKTLDVNEMKSLFTEVQNKFPNNSSLWVKDLVTFMNLKLNVKESDPVFTDQPIDYPLSKVGNGIRNVMISSLKKCSPATIQLFYEFCIQEMISDRKKNLPSYGYRIYLQCIAREYPHVPISNIPKYSDMISKKQNGPASCLSVMWSLGQAGYRNFETGLKIWLELMFPHLSTKALTNFVVLYLGNLFKNRKDKSAGYRVIGPNEFFPIMDFIFTPHNGLSSNLQKKLLEYYPKLKELAFGKDPSTNLRNYFPSLLARATVNCPQALKTELLTCLSMCLSTDPHCFSVWCQMYTSHMEQSNVLMNHLLLTWNTISNKLPLNTLRDTVRAFSVTNDELTGKSNQTPYLNQCQRVCKELMAKMTAAKFPWKYMVLLLMTGMVALVTYDIYRYRGFHGSKTDLFLEESGVKTASVQAWNKVTLYSAKANIWMKDNIPYYYSKACEFSEPYLQLLWEKLYQAGVYLAEVTKPQRQWIDEKIPLVLAWIEEWIPIVLASVRYYVSEAWLFLVYYITLLWNNVSPYLHTTGTWLQENVFVGKLSQESISDGLNVTWNVVQNYTIAFRHWCSEMMSTVATE